MLSEALELFVFSNQCRVTYRAIRAVGEDRNENDAEHSWQLGIFAWYLIDAFGLKLDDNRAMKYASVHDMDEVFEGDTSIWDISGRKDKELKASMARDKIIEMFPKWEGYKDVALAYVAQLDEESRFINALDKLVPVLNIYIDGGRQWHEDGTTLEKLIQNKRDKVKVHPFVEKLWYELEPLLQVRELELFGKMA